MIPDTTPASDKHTAPAAETDPTAVSRKQDHIELAFKSRVEAAVVDDRFFYEPLLAAHPGNDFWPPFSFLGKQIRTPVWVSSMTGGTALARTINRNLARACAEFGMGMGLGSCRQLLYSDEYLSDFDVRDTLGAALPLFVNLGIAQLEQLIADKETRRISDLVDRLRADGLIIHVNPLQEAMQPEGDYFQKPPIETIRAVLDAYPGPVIVKEVGQGFGPESLKALLQLPLAAIEFAAAGGTNFAKLELLRSDPQKQMTFEKMARVGHTAADMVQMTNDLVLALGDKRQTGHLIISGGVRDFLDGYYLIRQSALPAVYGQAAGFLQYARDDYQTLQAYVRAQVRGLALASAFLRVKPLKTGSGS